MISKGKHFKFWVQGKPPNHTENANQYQGEGKMGRIKNFVKDESGASAVEYGLLVSLIAVAIIGAVSTLGTNLGNTFNAASNKLSAS